MSGMRKLVVLALLVAGCSGGQAPRAPVQVRIEPHLGVDPGVYMESPDAKIVAVALPQMAGRIVHYALDGQNILWNPDKQGQPQPGGGYGLDLGPERTIPSHPTIWTQKYVWAKLGTNIVTLTSERDPAVGMRVEKQITMSPDGSLDLIQRMKNVSDQDKAWCFWDRTLCRAGGYCIIPLNEKSRFPAKWSLGTRKGPVWWEYNGVDPAHPGIKILDGMLVSKSQGKEQKIGVDSDAGWIAYIRGRLLFVKYYPYFPKGNYIDNGLSVAHYFSETLAELEPLSPEAPLKPEGEYMFPERWTLTRLDHDVLSHEDARAVAAKIPPSPFNR